LTSETSQSEATSGQAAHSESAQANSGQVDFYLLADATLSADHLACRLSMMAWERQQQVFIVATSEQHLATLDELMWQFPAGRFLPHAQVNDPTSRKAPVKLGLGSDLDSDAKGASVVINLCPEAITQPSKFSRILEIVPFVKEQRDASRTKYKNYLQLGLKPQTHEIS